jgi:hypothetical protein
MSHCRSSSCRRLKINEASTVRVDFLDILVELSLEILAPSRLLILTTCSFKVVNQFRVDELMVDHVLHFTLLEFVVLKAHHSIPDQKAL